MKRYFSYKNLRLIHVEESETKRGIPFKKIILLNEFNETKKALFIFKNHFKLYEELDLYRNKYYDVFGFTTDNGLFEYKVITCIKKQSKIIFI